PWSAPQTSGGPAGMPSTRQLISVAAYEIAPPPERAKSLHRVELVAARIVDRADGADLDAHAALRAVFIEGQVDLVQEDRVRRARADAGSAVHAQHVVDRHDAVVADRGTDRYDLLRHGGHATPRSAPRTSSRFPRGSSAPCCMRRTG